VVIALQEVRIGLVIKGLLLQRVESGRLNGSVKGHLVYPPLY